MSETDKTRVEVSIPRIKKPFYLRAYVIVAVMAGLAIIGVVYHIKTTPKEAMPMGGTCYDAPVMKYVGDGDRDGKFCKWHSRNYWCQFDPNKQLWWCDMINDPPVATPVLVPVPAEKKP